MTTTLPKLDSSTRLADVLATLRLLEASAANPCRSRLGLDCSDRHGLCAVHRPTIRVAARVLRGTFRPAR